MNYVCAFFSMLACSVCLACAWIAWSAAQDVRRGGKR